MSGRLRYRIALLCGAVAFGVPVLCFAQDSEARGAYESGLSRTKQGDYEGAVLDFAKAMELAPKNPAYVAARGNARLALGAADEAIADFTKAIEMDPSRRVPYINRGVARVDKGDLDGGIADWTKAIALEAKTGAAYCNRGWTRMLKGDMDGARGDLLRAIQLASDEGAYPRFYLYVLGMKQRSGMSPEELKAVVAQWKDGWTKAVGQFLCGGMGEAELLEQAALGAPKTVREQKCEGCYYAGVVRLCRGDAAGAKVLFEKCVATQMHTFPEYQMAKAELAKIGR